MNVRFKTPKDRKGPFSARAMEIEGVRHVVKGQINFDYNEGTPITAELEVNLGSVDVEADATLFTTIDGKRYRLVEEL